MMMQCSNCFELSNRGTPISLCLHAVLEQDLTFFNFVSRQIMKRKPNSFCRLKLVVTFIMSFMFNMHCQGTCKHVIAQLQHGGRNGPYYVHRRVESEDLKWCSETLMHFIDQSSGSHREEALCSLFRGVYAFTLTHSHSFGTTSPREQVQLFCIIAREQKKMFSSLLLRRCQHQKKLWVRLVSSNSTNDDLREL